MKLNCTNAFPQDNHCTSVCSRSILGILPILSHRLKRHALKGQDLIKLIIFTAFSKTFVSENDFSFFSSSFFFFLNCRCVVMKNILTITTAWCHSLAFCWGNQSYIHCQWKHQPHEKGKQPLDIIMILAPTTHNPWRNLGNLQDSMDPLWEPLF